jgi:hypothetical protein
MSLKVFIYAYRKPGLSLDYFKKHYEDHVDLVKRLFREYFLISHSAATSRAILSRSPPRVPAIAIPGLQTQ